jgi:hypothetical protein
MSGRCQRALCWSHQAAEMAGLIGQDLPGLLSILGQKEDEKTGMWFISTLTCPNPYSSSRFSERSG